MVVIAARFCISLICEYGPHMKRVPAPESRLQFPAILRLGMFGLLLATFYLFHSNVLANILNSWQANRRPGSKRKGSGRTNCNAHCQAVDILIKIIRRIAGESVGGGVRNAFGLDERTSNEIGACRGWKQVDK